MTSSTSISAVLCFAYQAADRSWLVSQGRGLRDDEFRANFWRARGDAAPDVPVACDRRAADAPCESAARTGAEFACIQD
eukprot:6174366-Pleurochrysis_carterae.AAC.1